MVTKHFDGETGTKISEPDLINFPPHYVGGRWEAIDIIEALGNQFRLGNALKYIFRHQKKGGVEDLKKARWYLERELAQDAMPLSGRFDLAFFQANARFFARDFGIEDLDLSNAVAHINAAHWGIWYQDEASWRDDVRSAHALLNSHILGLMGPGISITNCRVVGSGFDVGKIKPE